MLSKFGWHHHWLRIFILWCYCALVAGWRYLAPRLYIEPEEICAHLLGSCPVDERIDTQQTETVSFITEYIQTLVLLLLSLCFGISNA